MEKRKKERKKEKREKIKRMNERKEEKANWMKEIVKENRGKRVSRND